MKKVKINMNNPKVEIENVLPLRGSREFTPCYFDGREVSYIDEDIPEEERPRFNAIQIDFDHRHNCSVGEFLHFRKRSGAPSVMSDLWGCFEEVEVPVLASLDENSLVVGIPHDNFVTYINSADVETHIDTELNIDIKSHMVSISDNFLILPEDFDELGYDNQAIFYLRLEDYNKNEADWVKIQYLRPVYRKSPDFGSEFNRNYDREWINSSEFGVTDVNTLYELPILSRYTYIPDENVLEGGTEVESVPEDPEITEDSPELIYTVEILNDCGIVSEVDDMFYVRTPEPGTVQPYCDENGNPIIDPCEYYSGYTTSARTYYRKIEQVVFDLERLATIPVTVNMLYGNKDVFANNYFYEIDGTYRFYQSVDLVRKRNYYELGVPIMENSDYNMLQQNTIDELFSSEIKDNVVPEVIDMEKVMFEPAFGKSADDMVREIEFNFHFRERELEYKKIVGNPSNEVYGYLKDKPTFESVPTNLSADMFVEQKYIRVYTGGTSADYYELVYKDGWNVVEDKGWNGIPLNSQTSAQRFWKSDLIGHLNFNDDDVHYQKMKLKKSFIRLSFYDSDNPLTQQLLYYSTIFLDSGEIFGKFVKNRATNKWFGVFNESDDEEGRLGVTVSVKDKYNMTKSSEGFYLYLFNSEVTKENPSKDIYMKVEFNHAGYGRILPFTKPNLNVSGDNMNITPISFSNYFKRVYIKLGAQYVPYGDHHYVYFVDDENTDTFMSIDGVNKKIIFNLFEVLIEN